MISFRANYMLAVAILVAEIITWTSPVCEAFSVTPSQGNYKHAAIIKTIPSRVVGRRSNIILNMAGVGQFELQELKAQVTAMLEQEVASSNLKPEKMSELTDYVKTVCQTQESPIPLKEIGTEQNIKNNLIGRWRLAFSSENAALSVMPRESRILVNILNEKQLEYILEFSKKVQGLSKITAKSNYLIDTSPINPGLVTFVYEEITSKLFGATIPVGLFGMLKGRATYIESMYFDGKMWIERGSNPENGELFYNVYLKEGEAWR